jgi:hypothetical protein
LPQGYEAKTSPARDVCGSSLRKSPSTSGKSAAATSSSVSDSKIIRVASLYRKGGLGNSGAETGIEKPNRVFLRLPFTGVVLLPERPSFLDGTGTAWPQPSRMPERLGRAKRLLSR